jgi:hypothetical protein
MVWDETISTYKEMLSFEGWDKKKTVSYQSIQEITFKVFWHYIPPPIRPSLSG